MSESFRGVPGEYTRADIEAFVRSEVERALFHCARREDDGDRERINAYLAQRFGEAAPCACGGAVTDQNCTHTPAKCYDRTVFSAPGVRREPAPEPCGKFVSSAILHCEFPLHHEGPHGTPNDQPTPSAPETATAAFSLADRPIRLWDVGWRLMSPAERDFIRASAEERVARGHETFADPEASQRDWRSFDAARRVVEEGK